MRYRDSLRMEGICSIVLGLALAGLAFPGLVVSYPAWGAGLLFPPALIVLIALWAVARRGASPARPGEWLTARSLAEARPGRPALDPSPIRRRLVLETAAWVAGSALWLTLSGSGGLLFFGTGLASAAFGVLQAFPSRVRVLAAEAEQQRTYVIARRPGFGTPDLGVLPVDV